MTTVTEMNGPVEFEHVRGVVRARFGPDELAELASANTNASGRERFQLLNLVASWGYGVRTVVAQLDRSLDERDPTVLAAHDLVGVLFTRDRVERTAALVPEELDDRVRDVLEVFDAEYHAITVDDTSAEVTRVGDVRRFRAGWWWHRVPVRGPVRQELDEPGGAARR